eukprot:jgi/Botrbrau1/20563/Bobra.145_2s0110.1
MKYHNVHKAVLKRDCMLHVSFGVQASSSDAIGARAKTTALVDKITSTLREKYSYNQSISITTSSLNVYPQYGYNYQTYESYVNGYSFYITLFASLRNVTADSVAEVVDAIINAGNNGAASGQTSVYNIQFDLSNEVAGALYRSARKSAALDAVYTAEQYASYLGLRLGELLTLEESTTDSGTAGPFVLPSTSLDIPVATYANGTSPISLTAQAVNVHVKASFVILGAATPPPSMPSLPTPEPYSPPPLEASPPLPPPSELSPPTVAPTQAPEGLAPASAPGSTEAPVAGPLASSEVFPLNADSFRADFLGR